MRASAFNGRFAGLVSLGIKAVKSVRIWNLTRRWIGASSVPWNLGVPVVDGDVFERLTVWVINLDRRPDRLSKVSAQLSSIGVKNWNRITAVDGKKKFPDLNSVASGSIACNFGHLSGIFSGLSTDAEAIMICEDDLEFLADVSTVKKTIEEFLANPLLDVLSLSGRARGGSIQISELLRISIGIVGRGCYLVKPRAALPLTLAFSSGLEPLSRDDLRGKGDRTWARLQRSSLFFCTPTRKLATQSMDYSDIEDVFLGPR